MKIHISLACHFVDSYFTDVEIINIFVFPLLPNFLVVNTFGIDTSNIMKIFCSVMEQ